MRPTCTPSPRRARPRATETCSIRWRDLAARAPSGQQCSPQFGALYVFVQRVSSLFNWRLNGRKQLVAPKGYKDKICLFECQIPLFKLVFQTPMFGSKCQPSDQVHSSPSWHHRVIMVPFAKTCPLFRCKWLSNNGLPLNPSKRGGSPQSSFTANLGLSNLDCCWVGSLGFNFWGNQGFSLKPGNLEGANN